MWFEFQNLLQAEKTPTASQPFKKEVIKSLNVSTGVFQVYKKGRMLLRVTTAGNPSMACATFPPYRVRPY